MPLVFLSGCYSIPWVGLLLAPQTTSRALSLNCSSFEACADYTNCYSFLLQTSADSVSLLPHCSKILSLGPLSSCQILVVVIFVDLIIQMDILFQYSASQSLGFPLLQRPSLSSPTSDTHSHVISFPISALSPSPQSPMCQLRTNFTLFPILSYFTGSNSSSVPSRPTVHCSCILLVSTISPVSTLSSYRA